MYIYIFHPYSTGYIFICKFFISKESEHFNNIASKWLKHTIKAEVVDI